jgi:hypothetical protein
MIRKVRREERERRREREREEKRENERKRRVEGGRWGGGERQGERELTLSRMWPFCMVVRKLTYNETIYLLTTN